MANPQSPAEPDLAAPRRAPRCLAGREEAASAPPAGRFGGGEAAGQARAGLLRPGWEEERRRGAGECPGRRGRGRLDSSRGGRREGWRAGCLPGPGTAGGTRLESCLSDLGWILRENPHHSHPGHFLTYLQIPFHFAQFLARSGIVQELTIFAVGLLSN